MRKDWEVKKLGDICRIEYGFPFNSKFFTSDSTFMPLIRIRDLKDFRPATFYAGEYDSNYIVRKGDYLIGMDGEFNIIKWKGNDGLLNQRICRVTSAVKELLNPFLLSYLPIPLKAIEDATPFVTVKHLSAAKINNIDVPVPPLQTQQQIVEELDCLTSIIEKQKKQLEELDNLAQAIFYDMFGDPIKNEKGWDLYQLGKFAQLINGRAYKQEELLSQGKYPVLRVGNLFSNNKFYYSDLELSDDKYCNNKDLLYAWSASFGAYIWHGHKVIFHYHIWKIILNELLANKTYMCYLLNITTKDMNSSLHGVAMMHLTKSGMEQTSFILPPLPLQQQFASKIEEIEKQKELIKKSIKETEDLFNSRMDYYFN